MEFADSDLKSAGGSWHVQQVDCVPLLRKGSGSKFQAQCDAELTGDTQ